VADVLNERVGFVSENSWDVRGGASAGLRTFWLHRTADAREEELGARAAAVIRSLTELRTPYHG
jgi:hypothetical protein